jgi:hypothetical protein
MYLQNHDMDDVFRKAAARYPLKAGDSEWESIAEKLKAADSRPVLGNIFRLRKNRAFLIIIPVAFLFHNSFNKGSVAIDVPATTTQVFNNSKRSDRTGSKVIVPKKVMVVRAPENDLSLKPVEHSFLSASLPKLPGDDKYNVTGSVELPEGLPVSQPTPLPIQPLRMPVRRTGFYIGLQAGLDLGTVKGQSFTKAGYGIGILAGFRFNRHLSFESGLSFIQKQYYTRGEHFSMKKIESSMPGGMEMIDVNGRLSLFEVPYKLKYDFMLKEKSNFFIAAGGSTNLYIKETNEYQTKVNGVPESMQASYNDIHCAPICLVHLSGGYEQLLKNKSRIRLEPYIKIPLRNVGMGSVPIFSVGLNVSVSNFTGR